MEPNENLGRQTGRTEPVDQSQSHSPVATVSDPPEESAASAPQPEGGRVSPIAQRQSGLGYIDLFYLALFAIPSFMVSMIVGLALFFGLNYSTGWDFSLEDTGAQATIAIAVQLLWWLLVLGFIYALVTVKRGLQFRETIAWHPPERQPLLRGAWYCFLGFLLAFSVALIASKIPMPEEKLPFEELLRDRSSLILVAIFGVGVAPVAEELVFRGFAFAVFQRAHGVAAAVVITSAVFSFIHGQQYGWHWQNLVLLFYVGLIFGWVRAKTKSVVPATIIHAAYNTTLLLGLLLAGEELERL